MAAPSSSGPEKSERSENRLAVRASDAEREKVIAMLREHTARGRLTLDEFDERLGEVYAAKTVGDLQRATRDLAVTEAPVAPPTPTVSRSSVDVSVPVIRVHGHHKHARVTRYMTLSAILVAIWVMSGGGYFWPMWPIVILGILTVRRLLAE